MSILAWRSSIIGRNIVQLPFSLDRQACLARVFAGCGNCWKVPGGVGSGFKQAENAQQESTMPQPIPRCSYHTYTPGTDQDDQ